MSLIGTLEQFSLSTVLQRVEKHEKTGLLTLKNQGSQEIQFYLHEGQLLCIGPVRTQASLGERLLQDGIISPMVWRETKLVLGAEHPTESRIARKLMELNYVGREELRAWAIRKAVEVLDVVLSWPSGEVYFEEDVFPPTDRLLVTMSISSLLESASPSNYVASSPLSSLPLPPQETPAPSRVEPLPSVYPNVEIGSPSTPSPDIAHLTTLMDAAQFVGDATFAASSLSGPFADVGPGLPQTESFAPLLPDDQGASLGDPFIGGDADAVSFSSFFAQADDAGISRAPVPFQPVPVMEPVRPKQIDTSFLQPDMVLLPADLSAYRDQNPPVLLTPQQWSLLTLIDGRSTLEMIRQALNVPADFVRTVAGELIAEKLVYVSMPGAQPMLAAPSVPYEMTPSSLPGGYVAPGYASATASPWSASLPVVATSGEIPQAGLPMISSPTEAQWGNGGNGFSFIPGRGWVSSQSTQPRQPDNIPPGLYVPVGG